MIFSFRRNFPPKYEKIEKKASLPDADPHLRYDNIFFKKFLIIAKINAKIIKNFAMGDYLQELQHTKMFVAFAMQRFPLAIG